MPESVIDINTLFGFWPWRQVDIRLERLLELMNQHGITHACSLSARGLFINHDRGNRETLEAASQHSQIIPVGTIDIRTGPTASDVDHWCDLGFSWFRFFIAQSWDLDNLTFKALCDAFRERSCVLMIPSSMGLSNIARLADQYTSPIIVLETSFSYLAELEKLLSYEHVYADISKINCVDSLIWLAEKGRSRQLLFGSRAPLCYPSSVLNLVNDPTVDRSLRQRILYENANQLLGVLGSISSCPVECRNAH